MTGTLLHSDFADGDEIEVNFETGEILHVLTNDKYLVQPFAKVQMEIYQRGGLLE